MKIIMPNAPSVNWLYAGNGRIRYKSKVYKAWIKEADIQVNLEWLEIKPNTELLVDIEMHSEWFNKGNGRIKKKDILNFQKSLLDYLNDNLKWFEDECIFKVTLTKKPNYPPLIETSVVTIQENNTGVR